MLQLIEKSAYVIYEWPQRYLLAYACDDKDKYDRDRDSGSLKVWGFPSDE